MFRTGFLSVIRSLVLYTQQLEYVIQVMLTACQQAVSKTCMTYTYCCAYSIRFLMMDRKPVRNMQSSIPKINLRNQCISLVLSSSSQHNMYDVYQLLCIQYQTPDDGQKTCPKHVKFYSKNKFEKLVHLVSFIIRTCFSLMLYSLSNLMYGA